MCPTNDDEGILSRRSKLIRKKIDLKKSWFVHIRVYCSYDDIIYTIKFCFPFSILNINQMTFEKGCVRQSRMLRENNSWKYHLSISFWCTFWQIKWPAGRRRKRILHYFWTDVTFATFLLKYEPFFTSK